VSKKPKPPPDDPEQAARFIETAKATGASDKDFLHALKKIVPARPKPRKKALNR
jgi:hypothetical protein